MPTSYHHLTYHDRIQIHALLQLRYKPSKIATHLGRPVCTISRELNRNSFGEIYFLETAQINADLRRSLASADRDSDEELDAMIEQGLRHGMSPAQIAGRLRAEGVAGTSTSNIYSKIKKDKVAGGDLWMFLRHARKSYRKNYGAGASFSNEIKNRVSIDERPDIVDFKERKGDLEGDTVIGAKHKGVLLTMNDRVTKKVSIDKLKSKKSDEVSEAMIHATEKFDGVKHTCTLDNGKEFAGHEDFTDVTGIKVYFCRPSSPEERGANENTNGLIRQYIPKGSDITKVTKTRIKFIERSLNSRPRKTLNFLTPIEAESDGKVQFNFFS
jgi:IS30 family transposase